MGSLQHDEAVRSPIRRRAAGVALLAATLIAACGGSRDRASGMDSTGIHAAAPDSAAMPAAEAPTVDSTAAPAAPSAPAEEKAPPAPPTAAKPPREAKPTTTAPAAPAPAPSAAVPAPTAAAAAPSQQDTASAPTADAPLRDAYHLAPRDTVTQTVYSGWKQFNLNCARCHGEDVLGTTIAPHLIVSLKPNGPINTKELFVQTVCAGRPEKGMPAWCALGLEMDKINDIYEYVKGRSDAKIGPGRPAVKPQG